MLADADPLVRRAAVDEVAGDPGSLGAQLTRLLGDPVRDVRIAAARALAGPGELRLAEADRTAFRSALEEFIAVQRYNEIVARRI